ncbi:MAG: GHKL domain-containing protein, partial [Candidatus Sabulitectum sp.]|nr:GHKL domain-containing protein [Candidatus Sabulitectum sp.]
MVISERRRTWLQVGRLSVLGILTLSGIFAMDQAGLTVVYALVAATAIASSLITSVIMKKAPQSRKPYWFLLFVDTILLSTIIYVSGGVDGPFTPFLVIHVFAYGFYLGVAGGLTAAASNVLLATAFAIIALNVPGSKSTLSPLLETLVQTGQLKLSTTYIALRILINGLLLVASGIASGMLAQSLYMESGHLQRVLNNLAEVRARSRHILDSLHDGVVVVGSTGDMISINPAAVELLGTDKPMIDSQLGGIVISFLQNRDFPPGIDIVVQEKVIECRFSHYGDTDGAIVVLTDTTELRNYQAALEERDKLSLIGRLSATMAHEIRNPLASMSGAAEMLAAGRLDKDTSERMASLIEKQSRRVSELIEGYLSLSRSSSDFPFKKISVNEVVMDSVESVMHGFAGGVSMEVLPAETNPMILGNKVRLGQVFLNLMRNSVEALGKVPEPLISIETSITDKGRVCVSVKDNGPGIPEDFIKQIWEPFKTSRDHGTGLGLYIVRRIISEHNGTIEVKNSTGGGAVFRIEFARAGDDTGE